MGLLMCCSCACALVALCVCLHVCSKKSPANVLFVFCWRSGRLGCVRTANVLRRCCYCVVRLVFVCRLRVACVLLVCCKGATDVFLVVCWCIGCVVCVCCLCVLPVYSLCVTKVFRMRCSRLACIGCELPGFVVLLAFVLVC